MQRMDGEIDLVALRELAERWWLFVVAGALSLLVGVVILFRPIAGVFGLAILIAVGLVVSGAGEIAGAKRFDKRWIPYTFGGLSVAAGLGTVIWPGITLWVLAVFIGASLVVRGIVHVVGAIAVRPRWWGALAGLGVVEAGLGVAALVWPGATIVVLAVLMGLNLIIGGTAQMAFGFALRNVDEGPPPAVA